MGGEEKSEMDWVEEEKSRRRVGEGWTNCVNRRRVGQFGLEEKGGMDWV